MLINTTIAGYQIHFNANFTTMVVNESEDVQKGVWPIVSAHETVAKTEISKVNL